ncbi:MAG: SMI1/KNR4 family protein [Verrucomicrobia bacterium]|nr:SMI1/KNR4 family protein [Verrucomicrobiota bacterium]
MPLQAVYRHFENYHPSASDFDVFSARGSEASEQDVARFEANVGFRFPDEFREFSTSYLGGLYMRAKEDIWPAGKEGDVGPYWSFLCGLIVFGVSKEAPDEIQMKTQLDEFEGNFGKTGLVPFMRIIGSADRYCFDASGRIHEFYHDDIANPRPSDLCFSDLLMEEIGALIERTNKKKLA